MTTMARAFGAGSLHTAGVMSTRSYQSRAEPAGMNVSLTQVLSLANNQLCMLPASFSNLTRLKKLNLSQTSPLTACVYNMKVLVGPAAAAA